MLFMFKSILYAKKGAFSHLFEFTVISEHGRLAERKTAGEMVWQDYPNYGMDDLFSH
jgi:hypothetical protein